MCSSGPEGFAGSSVFCASSSVTVFTHCCDLHSTVGVSLSAASRCPALWLWFICHQQKLLDVNCFLNWCCFHLAVIQNESATWSCSVLKSSWSSHTQFCCCTSLDDKDVNFPDLHQQIMESVLSREPSSIQDSWKSISSFCVMTNQNQNQNTTSCRNVWLSICHWADSRSGPILHLGRNSPSLCHVTSLSLIQILISHSVLSDWALNSDSLFHFFSQQAAGQTEW